jgi:O-antigen ligase
MCAWAALFFNVLAFAGGPMLFPLPHTIGQALPQGALLVALAFALLANPRSVIRPTLFLVLMSMMALAAAAVSIHNEFPVGSTYRAGRFIVFLAVIWLLTPWWGRRDMLLLRCHRRVLWAIVASVWLGLLVAPGTARSFEGRLSGVLWPIPPTQVAHYAMVLAGTTILLWMCRVITGRHTVIALVATAPVLLLTHTRTALVAGAVAAVVAIASLFIGHARVRRASALGVIIVVLLATVFASEITSWMRRGQSSQGLSNLTGRTKVWDQVFDTPRPRMNDLFGAGMSNQSFHGRPIDSSWVATYVDQGWLGVIVCASLLLLLLMMAATRPRSPHRAVALFLIVYCLVASFTETGLGTPSPYLLDLSVAVALLVPEARWRRT